MSNPPQPQPGSEEVPSGQKPKSYNDVFRSRQAVSSFADPCEHARAESMACLDRASYDKSKCIDFFQAVRCKCVRQKPSETLYLNFSHRQYRDCKKDWLEQRRSDRRAGKDVA